MRCPQCGSKYIRVLSKKDSGYNTIVRTRRCRTCGFRFRTTEVPSKRDESFAEYLNRMIYEMQGSEG